MLATTKWFPVVSKKSLRIRSPPSLVVSCACDATRGALLLPSPLMLREVEEAVAAAATAAGRTGMAACNQCR